jgi:hypothetical protein
VSEVYAAPACVLKWLVVCSLSVCGGLGVVVMEAAASYSLPVSLPACVYLARHQHNSNTGDPYNHDHTSDPDASPLDGRRATATGATRGRGVPILCVWSLWVWRSGEGGQEVWGPVVVAAACPDEVFLLDRPGPTASAIDDDLDGDWPPGMLGTADMGAATHGQDPLQ